jgi:hypothetical protein
MRGGAALKRRERRRAKKREVHSHVVSRESDESFDEQLSVFLG